MALGGIASRIFLASAASRWRARFQPSSSTRRVMPWLSVSTILCRSSEKM
jgi:hypothetical protein